MEGKPESKDVNTGDTSTSADEKSMSSLKLFYDSNLGKMDLNSDKHVDSNELNAYKRNFPALSPERRKIEALQDNLDEIEYLSRDPGFHIFKHHGIKPSDMQILSSKSESDPLVNKVNSSLADRDYKRAISKGIELTQDNTYVVEFAMGKTSYTLDPFEHLANFAQREYKTTIVDKNQYDAYRVGERLSTQSDWVKFLSDGSFHDYWVSVNDKHVEQSFSWTDEKQGVHPISSDAYKALKSEISAKGKTTFDVPYQGADHTYISEKPLSEMNIVSREPLQRHFLQLDVGNNSFSFSLTRQLRNLTTRHKLDVEVPEDVYEKSNAAWNPSLNNGSLWFGKLHVMTSDIKKRWSELDPSYEKVTTDEGRKFIVEKRNH